MYKLIAFVDRCIIKQINSKIKSSTLGGITFANNDRIFRPVNNFLSLAMTGIVIKTIFVHNVHILQLN